METDLIPEMFEEVINNFIMTNKDSIVKYVKVNDIDIDYPEGWGEQRYILNVDVYVKEGLLGENGLKGFGPNVAWNSFEKKLEKNTIFKNYLGLPENKDYNDFRVSLVGNFREGFPKKKIDLQEQIKRILKEETKFNLRLRRRIEHLDDEIKRVIRILYKPETVCSYESDVELLENVIEDTIDAMYWTYFSELSDKNTGEWGEIYSNMRKYLKNNYTDKIKEYYHINCGN